MFCCLRTMPTCCSQKTASPGYLKQWAVVTRWHRQRWSECVVATPNPSRKPVTLKTQQLSWVMQYYGVNDSQILSFCQSFLQYLLKELCGHQKLLIRRPESEGLGQLGCNRRLLSCLDSSVSLVRAGDDGLLSSCIMWLSHMACRHLQQHKAIIRRLLWNIKYKYTLLWRSVLVTHLNSSASAYVHKSINYSQPAELRQLWIHKQHRAEHTMARAKECVGNYKVIQACRKCQIRWALSHLLLIGFYLSIKALSVTLSTFISVLFEWKWQKM